WRARGLGTRGRPVRDRGGRDGAPSGRPGARDPPAGQGGRAAPGDAQAVRRALGVIAAALVTASCASAGSERPQRGFRTLFSGLDSPLYATAAPGEPNNLYIVE